MPRKIIDPPNEEKGDCFDCKVHNYIQCPILVERFNSGMDGYPEGECETKQIVYRILEWTKKNRGAK